MRNFHIPLPEETYVKLRAESDRAKVPATSLARQAIDAWLKAQAKAARHETIAAYAAEFGGTEFDLDPELEAASVEFLLSQNQHETW